MSKINRIKAYLNVTNWVVNFRLLPFMQAIKLPIIIHGKIKIKSLSGKVELTDCKFGLIKFGVFNSVQTITQEYYTVLDVKGNLKFNGHANFGVGCSILSRTNSRIEFGRAFHCTGKLSIDCVNSILMGNNQLYAWNIIIMDHDYHKIYNQSTSEILNLPKAIVINDNVWIGANSTILKGSIIEEMVVISNNSLVTSSSKLISNSIYGGIPVKMLKNNIYWTE
jgi:acetyltransferase-like isoleucine patch superfamily enzyme